MKLRTGREKRKGIKKFLYNMRLRWEHGIVPGWYDFKRGIKNLVRWFPHVWKYADWDGDYTLDMLIASLNFQLKRLETYSMEVDETLEPKIKDIKEVIRLLTKVKDENIYTDEIYEYYDSIYGEDEMYFVPYIRSEEELVKHGKEGNYNKNGEPLYYSMESTRKDKLGKEEYEKYSKERMEKIKKAMEQRDADRKRAFEIIAENIDGWWE